MNFPQGWPRMVGAFAAGILLLIGLGLLGLGGYWLIAGVACMAGVGAILGKIGF